MTFCATPEADTPAAWVRYRVPAELLGEAAGAGGARPEQHRRPQLAGALAAASEEWSWGVHSAVRMYCSGGVLLCLPPARLPCAGCCSAPARMELVCNASFLYVGGVHPQKENPSKTLCCAGALGGLTHWTVGLLATIICQKTLLKPYRCR